MQYTNINLIGKEEHLSNFSRGYYEEHLCEIILNLDQRFRKRCHLTIFLIYSSGGHLVRSGTIYTGGKPRNYHEIVLT